MLARKKCHRGVRNSGDIFCRKEFYVTLVPDPRVTEDALLEGLDAGHRAAQNQGVDVVRAFVGVDHFQVHHVADDAEFLRNFYVFS